MTITIMTTKYNNTPLQLVKEQTILNWNSYPVYLKKDVDLKQAITLLSGSMESPSKMGGLTKEDIENSRCIQAIDKIFSEAIKEYKDNLDYACNADLVFCLSTTKWKKDIVKIALAASFGGFFGYITYRLPAISSAVSSVVVPIAKRIAPLLPSAVTSTAVKVSVLAVSFAHGTGEVIKSYMPSAITSTAATIVSKVSVLAISSGQAISPYLTSGGAVTELVRATYNTSKNVSKNTSENRNKWLLDTDKKELVRYTTMKNTIIKEYDRLVDALFKRDEGVDLKDSLNQIKILKKLSNNLFKTPLESSKIIEMASNTHSDLEAILQSIGLHTPACKSLILMGNRKQELRDKIVECMTENKARFEICVAKFLTATNKVQSFEDYIEALKEEPFSIGDPELEAIAEIKGYEIRVIKVKDEMWEDVELNITFNFPNNGGFPISYLYLIQKNNCYYAYDA